jgi:hydroxymethylglutaryl-CoA lyase
MAAILDHLPERVSIYEVGPRDGLQNEAATVGTVRKLRLVEALVEAGVRRMELTSFVSPKWIPQLADASDLAKLVPRRPGLVYTALCPNPTGLERARLGGLDEVAVFLSASETHNRRNINKTIDEALAVFREVIAEARVANMRVRGYVSTVWGCPYEGDVDPAKAVALGRTLLEMGCYEISMGDTIGVGTPLQTKRILERCAGEMGLDKIAMHMHDTRGQALVNVLVGLEMGVRVVDAAIAGLGGCPYAPGASGNLATEDLVYMLHHMGVDTGIDPDKLWEAGRVAAAILNHPLPGRVHKAGLRSLTR